jgi:hypothetical protein
MIVHFFVIVSDIHPSFAARLVFELFTKSRYGPTTTAGDDNYFAAEIAAAYVLRNCQYLSRLRGSSDYSPDWNVSAHIKPRS